MSATAYFNKFSSYCKMAAHAKSLAKRSVLVDHCGLEHIDLAQECNNVDHIYSIENRTRRGLSKLSLIEFKTDDDANQLVKKAHNNEGSLPVPLKILRYSGRSGGGTLGRTESPYPIEQVRIAFDREWSPNFESYTDLVSNNLMSLIALKLRFVTLVNFEQILCSGIFSEYELMPFGSSVIHVGCDSGDLDLVLIRKDDHYQTIRNAASFLKGGGKANTIVQPRPPFKLVHLDTRLYSETKDISGVRGAIRWFDHVLREYMPLTDSRVVSLHRAKVPIIKFTSKITDIECDLGFDLGLDHRETDGVVPGNHSMLMTEVLYSLCRQNNLITASVIYLRIFAKLTSITSKTPNVGLTNFQFQSLIIFFLQRVTIKTSTSSALSGSPNGGQNQGHTTCSVEIVDTSRDRQNQELPLIPPFKSMINRSFLEGPRECVHYDENELNQIMPLVIGKFFEFYSKFDFASSCLDLYDARIDRKLDNSHIYVLNPLDTTQNICRNVTKKGLDNLVKQMLSASSKIEKSIGQVCPLILIRSLMHQKKHQEMMHQKKHQEMLLLVHQIKRRQNRKLNLGLDDPGLGPLDPEGIARDVCR